MYKNVFSVKELDSVVTHAMPAISCLPRMPLRCADILGVWVRSFEWLYWCQTFYMNCMHQRHNTVFVLKHLCLAANFRAYSQQELTHGSFWDGAKGYQPSGEGNMATFRGWRLSDFRHLFCFTHLIYIFDNIKMKFDFLFSLSLNVIVIFHRVKFNGGRWKFSNLKPDTFS